MKKLIVFALVSLVAVSAWRSHETAPKQSILKDRVWVDHVPRNEREMIDIFAVISRQPIGIFDKRSVWQGSFEAFRYEASGDEMRIVFPQKGDKEKLKIVARTCNERGMDYCLEISGSSRGVQRYYSRKGWEIGSTDDVEAKLRAISQ